MWWPADWLEPVRPGDPGWEREARVPMTGNVVLWRDLVRSETVPDWARAYRGRPGEPLTLARVQAFVDAVDVSLGCRADAVQSGRERLGE